MAIQMREDSKQRVDEAREKVADRAQMHHLITTIAAGYFGSKKKGGKRKKGRAIRSAAEAKITVAAVVTMKSRLMM